MGKPQWVAIFWTETKDYSVQKADCVKKEEMFLDREMIANVEHQGTSKKKPPAGWKCYPGRVITTGSNFV